MKSWLAVHSDFYNENEFLLFSSSAVSQIPILLNIFWKHDERSHLFLANAAWGVIWSIFNIVAYLLVVLTLLRVRIFSSRPYPSEGAYFFDPFSFFRGAGTSEFQVVLTFCERIRASLVLLYPVL
jgi:hypothetical protein